MEEQLKNNFRRTIYQFYSKKQEKNGAYMGNSDSELMDSSSHSDSESYWYDITDTETDNEKDVPQEIIFYFIRRCLKSHIKMNRKKSLLIWKIKTK